MYINVVIFIWFGFHLNPPPPPRSQGLPRARPRGNGPPSRMTHQCCKNFTTMKCIKLNHYKFRRAKRTFTGGCPSSKFCNAVRRNLSTLGMQQAGTGQTLTTKVRRNPTILTATQLTYCQVVLLVSFHHNDPTFSPTTLGVEGVGPLPHLAPAPLSRIRNALIMRPLPLIQPHQWPLEAEL